jgi:hypothetical protein
MTVRAPNIVCPLRCIRRALIASAALIVLAPPASAAPFTDPATFAAAVSLLPGTPSTVDFDSAPAGTTVPSGGTFGGITFTITSAPLDFVLTSNFETTSTANALGILGGDDTFLALDEWEMSFASTQALGLFIVSSDPLLAGDIELITSIGTATNAALEQTVLSDGGLVYFIGLVSNALPFASAQVRYGPAVTGINFLYTVDDITTVTAAQVPEPAMLVLMLGAGAAAYRRHQRHRVE